MKEAVKLEPDNGSGDGGLNAAQKLEVTEVVDTKVEKSENRVLHAIADFKGDLDRRLDRMDKRFDRMDERLDRMDGRLGTLESSLSFIKGTTTANVVLFLVLAGFIASGW